MQSQTWKRYALQVISLWGADFRLVDLLPVGLFEMTAVVSTFGDGENRRRLS